MDGLENVKLLRFGHTLSLDYYTLLLHGRDSNRRSHPEKVSFNAYGGLTSNRH